jgi:ankyrin repeat protein
MSIQRLFQRRKISSENLQIACKNGDVQEVETLIAKGLKTNKRSSLRLAAKYGHIKIVEIFLENNIDKERYWSALKMSAQHGHLDIVKLLIKKGALDAHKQSALSCASEFGQLKIVQYLVKNNCAVPTTDAVLKATQNHHFKIVKILVDNKPTSLNSKSFMHA